MDAGTRGASCPLANGATSCCQRSCGDFRWEAIDDLIVRSLERKGFHDLLTEIDPEFMELVHRTRDALGQN